MAAATRIALIKAARVITFDGVKSSRTISTIRTPVSYAICARSRYGAGIDAHPGNDMPNASATEFIDSAVPIVLQCPADGALAAAISMNSR